MKNLQDLDDLTRRVDAITESVAGQTAEKVISDLVAHAESETLIDIFYQIKAGEDFESRGLWMEAIHNKVGTAQLDALTPTGETK